MGIARSFKAVVHEGKLLPLNATLDFPENETVWVIVTALPEFELKVSSVNDLELLAIREKFANVAPLNLTQEVSEQRDRF